MFRTKPSCSGSSSGRKAGRWGYWPANRPALAASTKRSVTTSWLPPRPIGTSLPPKLRSTICATFGPSCRIRVTPATARTGPAVRQTYVLINWTPVPASNSNHASDLPWRCANTAISEADHQCRPGSGDAAARLGQVVGDRADLADSSLDRSRRSLEKTLGFYHPARPDLPTVSDDPLATEPH